MFKCDLNSLEKSLLELQIPQGSTIIIHSKLFSFGIIEGGVSVFYDMLKRVFDDSYTLVMPTFTFSFAKNGEWSYSRSKSETGALTEYMRTQRVSARSIHPFHSVCVEGRNADYLLNSICSSSFGKDSVFAKLYDLEAYNLSLGSEFVGGATFLHYAEELLQVPYRYYKNFPGKILDKFDNQLNINFSMFVRIIEKDHYFDNDWNILWQDLLQRDLVKYFKFNKTAPIFLMDIRECHNFLVEKIKNNPYYIAKKIES